MLGSALGQVVAAPSAMPPAGLGAVGHSPAPEEHGTAPRSAVAERIKSQLDKHISKGWREEPGVKEEGSSAAVSLPG